MASTTDYVDVERDGEHGGFLVNLYTADGDKRTAARFPSRKQAEHLEEVISETLKTWNVTFQSHHDY